VNDNSKPTSPSPSNPNVLDQQQKKLFKMLYKYEVFCERISANIEKGTLNALKKEYQALSKDCQRFISSLSL